MSEYDNELTGVLFRNEEKREGKRDPDYRGSAEVGRTQYWLDGWINEKKGGGKYLKLKFNPKQAKSVQGAVAHKAAAPDDFEADDIPF